MDSPARYRKKPVEVTAIRWTGATSVLADLIEWVEGEAPERDLIKRGNDDSLLLWIEKSRTYGTVRKGDWIIAERDGDGFYPCTAEQFAETYEPVEE